MMMMCPRVVTRLKEFNIESTQTSPRSREATNVHVTHQDLCQALRIPSPSPWNNPSRQALLLSPLHRWENWRLQSLKNTQNHPAHRWQTKVDSHKALVLPAAHCLPSGAKAVPVGEPNDLTHSVPLGSHPAFPSFQFCFICKTTGLCPSFDHILWLYMMLLLGKNTVMGTKQPSALVLWLLWNF